jgi:type III secretory pathway component EscS
MFWRRDIMISEELKENKEEEPVKKKQKEPILVMLRIYAIVWPLLHLAIFLPIGIYDIQNGSLGLGIFFIAFAVTIAVSIGSIILQNNFVSAIFFSGLDPLTEQYDSHVKGTHTGLRDFNRKSLLVDALFYAFLFTALFSIIIGAVVGIFVYPYALIENIQHSYFYI